MRCCQIPRVPRCRVLGKAGDKQSPLGPWLLRGCCCRPGDVRAPDPRDAAGMAAALRLRWRTGRRSSFGAVLGCTRAPPEAPVRGHGPGHGTARLSRRGRRGPGAAGASSVGRQQNTADGSAAAAAGGAGRRWEARSIAGPTLLCLGLPCISPPVPRASHSPCLGWCCPRNQKCDWNRREGHKNLWWVSTQNPSPVCPRMLEPWEHPCQGNTWCCGLTAVRQGAKEQLRETTHSEPHAGSRAVGQPGNGTPQPHPRPARTVSLWSQGICMAIEHPWAGPSLSIPEQLLRGM